MIEKYLNAEILGSAVRANIRLLRETLGEGVKFFPAVKSDCYGHGLKLLLNVIAGESDGLCVAAPCEADELRELGYEGEILVFFSACAYGRQEAIEAMVESNVTQTIVDECEIAMISAAASRVGKPALVHLKIDTGMGRSGAPADEAGSLVERINKSDSIKLTGMYTHFATADIAGEGKTFAIKQLEIFRKTIASCSLPKDIMLHTANSAALIDLPQSHMNMVRPGISIYGYQPSDEMQNKPALQPAMRLVGKLLQVKNIAAGSSCGYGLTFTFDKAGRIGRVPIGYGDGYMRCLSNRASVRIGQFDAPVIGKISMDQIIIDLTNSPNVQVGDEVEIISPDPAAPHSVENLARLAQTIPHEITCRLNSKRIHRVLV